MRINYILSSTLALAVGLLFSVEPAGAQSNLTGTIKIKGSGTVYTLTKVTANMFEKKHPGITVDVEPTGTSAGFKHFLAGETAINNASRPISEEERRQARANGIEFYEIPIAMDGVTIIKHPKNTFIDYLTTTEIRNIFKSNSPYDYWDDIRPQWPHIKIRVFGPNDSHGTYDFFKETILGGVGDFRDNYIGYQAYEDIVSSVYHNMYAIGYCGFNDFIQHYRKVKSVAVDAGDGPVEPNYESINQQQYKPLSRKLYLYVNAQMYNRSTVHEFVQFYLGDIKNFCRVSKYIPIDSTHYKRALYNLEHGNTGTMGRSLRLTSSSK